MQNTTAPSSTKSDSSIQSASASSPSNKKDSPEISSVSISSAGELVLKGNGLDQVSSLKITSDAGTVKLRLGTQSKTTLSASATSPLTLVAGTVYDLFISSAKAENTVFPIVIQLPNNLMGAQGPQGLQGPQGPQGPQGQQGIQGPVGAAFGGPNLRLVDGNGNVIGTAVVSNQEGRAIIWDSSTDSYFTYNLSTGRWIYAQSSIPIYFQSSNCTGQAYVRQQEVPSYHAIYMGGSLYKAGSTILNSISTGSYTTQFGGCQVLNGNNSVGYAALTQISNVFPQQLPMPLSLQRF
jgi:hypothetical protein